MYLIVSFESKAYRQAIKNKKMILQFSVAKFCRGSTDYTETINWAKIEMWPISCREKPKMI